MFYTLYPQFCITKNFTKDTQLGQKILATWGKFMVRKNIYVYVLSVEKISKENSSLFPFFIFAFFK